MNAKTLAVSFIALLLCTLLYAAPKRDNSFQELKIEVNGIIQQEMQQYTTHDLFYAVLNGDKAKVEEILDSKQVDVDVRDLTGQTPLMIASGKGHLEIAELLIEKGADVNAKDIHFRDSLEYTIILNHKEITELLVTNGAEITLYHLRCAVYYADADIVDLLLDNNEYLVHAYKGILKEAIYSRYTKCNTGVAKVLIDHGADTEGALNWASKAGCDGIVKILEQLSKNNPSLWDKMVESFIAEGQISK